ncbi:transcription initiation factor IIB [Candidatus Bathyarchaeota archaeon]|nr:transcription initiation factor IIB [Candidatus Bathyarchaeota archaeon]
MQHSIHIQRFLCPQCGSLELVRDEEMGEIVCSKCGLVVLEDMLNRSPEWRAFTVEEERSKRRAGAPIRYSHFDKGLSTVIRVDKDAFGRPLSSKAKRQMWRLRRWQIRSRIRSSDYRNLMRAMNELQRLSEKLHIPSSVQEMAAVLYRKALSLDLIRGRSIAAIVAAALYAACRFTKTPKTLKEVVEASLRDRDEVAGAYRLLIRTLQMKMPIHDPLDYVSKIAYEAGISGEVQGLAVKILREAKRKRITMGKDPMGVASAVLYIACQLMGKNVTQKEIADASGVTEVTIRNRKKELMKKLNLISDSRSELEVV